MVSYTFERVKRGLRKFGVLRPLNRHEYRTVWNSVSANLREAMVSVQGSSDENQFAVSAIATVETLKECVGINPNDTVLEIGAGVGRVGDLLAPLCKEWIATDVSDHMLSHLSRRLAKHQTIRTVLTNGFDLAPIASESVDLVYCTIVFMHLDEWERFNYVREGLRVLKPGGRMLVDNFSLTTDAGWDFFVKNMQMYPPAKRPPNISKSSTPQELFLYFEKAGFRNIAQRTGATLITTFGTKPR